MAEQKHKSKQSPSRRDGVDTTDESPATSESGEKLKAELDDLLDEIDEVLETNAEDFVKSYVQKGGQ
ncbi:ubiquitin-like protein Pup [soil metagenome]